MTSLADALRAAVARDPSGARVVPRLLACFSEAHWGAIRHPGRLLSAPDGLWTRDVVLPSTFAEWAARHPDVAAAPEADEDVAVHLPCVLETDSFVLAIEDATRHPLAPGTPAYAVRHRLSRVIEAVRVIARGRLYAVGVVAPAGFDEPRRAAILEGLPHLEREEAEDLYASYWGWCTPARFHEALDEQH